MQKMKKKNFFFSYESDKTSWGQNKIIDVCFCESYTHNYIDIYA